MLDRLLGISLRQPVLTIALVVLFSAGGLWAFRTIAIDAFPDVTPIWVQIVTKAPGLSPEEIERFVTVPLELQLTGSPGLNQIRSLSKVGLSMIDVIFDDDIDVYLARQVVLERILEAQERLPEGSVPQIVPNSTVLGEVFQYYLEGPHDHESGVELRETELIERRVLQDWVVRPALKSVSDVVDVNSMGGFVKQYQVLVEPDLLRKYDLALHEVFGAVARNNANAGGNIIETHGAKYVVRGVGLIKTVRDIENIVVKQVAGTPVYIRDVAEVRIGHAVRHGAVVVNGKHEAVAGIVLMLRGGNAREVVEGVKAKIAEIHDKGILPNGLRILPFYDRVELIRAALDTVYSALIEGIILVIVALFVFLGNVRSALIVAVTLGVAPLLTFLAMKYIGLTANLMSLGGMAIAIGMIVDASIVVVENVFRHLSEPSQHRVDHTQVVFQAAREVAQPVVFGILIIIVVFLPILSLQGVEGKMFQPLAYTIMMALMISLFLSLTLSPVLCALGLRQGTDHDTALVRVIKRVYLPLLRWSLIHRLVVGGIATVLLLSALALFPFLGGEFIPILNEGSIAPQIIRHPSIALEQSIAIEKEMHRRALQLPEVQLVVSKIGRTELGNDPQEPNSSDPVVSLSPVHTWTTATTKPAMDEALRKQLRHITGAQFLLTQPIQQRMDELLSGVRTEATVKILGDDLAVLRSLAEGIERVMRNIPGVKDIRVEQLFGQEYLNIDLDRDKMARHGINVEEVRELISTAIGGESATVVYEGQRRFDLMVRFPEQYRNSVQTIGNILLKTMTGGLVPLGELASIELREGPALISREGLMRRIYVGFNTYGRDIESIVAEAQQKIVRHIKVPAGYHLEWGGSFENMRRAMARLTIVVPITILLIFFLLYTSFASFQYALLIILNLPFALIGGIMALWVTGEYLSVPASVGFINLFGVAVLNGIVLVSYILKLRSEGVQGNEAIIQGCLLRLRPVLTTALVALLGLVPLALATGIGSEVQRPLAVVVIGGLVSSTALTLVVLPSILSWLFEHAVPSSGRHETSPAEEDNLPSRLVVETHPSLPQ